MKNINEMTVVEWLGESNQLGIDIWTKKYQQNNETFDTWLDRISGGNGELRQLIVEKKFLFAGRILSNRGLHKNGRKVTYSNCYVIAPPEDNIESIFQAAAKLARTFSYGGGSGMDISKLAPRGAAINNTAKETTGAVSFMELYNSITGLIGQNGRRGALMLSIDCNHPDLEEFISVKNDLNTITKANISVRIDDKFMHAVINDLEHKLIFVREETGEEISKIINAKVVFEQLCKNNWDFAEPGILFWDRIKSHNLLALDQEFEYAGVNPCAEEPLPAGGSCLLGSINLSEFVIDGGFDIYSFRDAVKVSVIALNEVLDEGLPLHPLQEQKDSVADWRQIGLGIFGLSDMLIKMGVEYGSKDSIELCDGIAAEMIDEAISTSSMLAKEFGAYPKFKPEALHDNPFFYNNTSDEVKKEVAQYGLRNSQLLTVAPTGTISTMLGVSGGIEPMFDTHYVRKTESLHGEDKYYNVYTPIVKKYMDATCMEDIQHLPSFFKTAKTIKPIDRILMQSIWQKRIDASISSTVNLPEDATVEDVRDLYTAAWEHGLKGLTIFRENCARLGILTSVKEEKEESIILDERLDRGQMKEIAEDTIYYKKKVGIGCGKLNLFIGYSESENAIQELFIEKSGQGGCEKNLKTTVIAMSYALRLGGTIEHMEKAFGGISTCSSFTGARKDGKLVSKGNNCGNAILFTIKDFLKEKEGVIESSEDRTKDIYEAVLSMIKGSEEEPVSKDICPECKTKMQMSGGCNTCVQCGYSKCD